MKRILSIILVFVLLFSLCSFGVNAAPEDQKQIKILAIGNSYSNNAVQYINSIAYTLGLNVTVTSLYDDGCPIQRHVEWYNTNAKEYEFYVDGVNISSPRKNTMKEVFERDDYDYITIQQGPSPAANFDTYWTPEKPWLTDLYAIIKKHEPQAEIMIHQTWSFSEADATGSSPYTQTSWRDSREMYRKIEAAYEKAADKLGIDKEKGIIPVGRAIQLAKDEYGYGDFYNAETAVSSFAAVENGALYNDNVDHLNVRGRYIAACVWIEKILGVDCRPATFYPGELFRDESAILRAIAHEAVTGEKQYVEGDWRYLPESNGAVELVHYMGKVPADGVIKIPETLNGKTVATVDDTAFKYIEGIKKIVLPNVNIKYEDGVLTGAYQVEDNRDESTLYTKKKKKKDDNGSDLMPVIIGVGVGVIVIAAAVVIFVIFKKKKKKKAE